jgi:hypothetical protein
VSAARSLAGYRAADTLRERDEFAAANIPAALIPLWNRVKRQFRGSPEERAEKFIQYAHDHESEDLDAVVSAADRKLDAMIRAHEAAERRAARGGFASPNALLAVLGLAALGYVIYRVTRKKPAPPPHHHASGYAWPTWPPEAQSYYYAWEG